MLCSWIFDLERGAPAPYGFTLSQTWRDDRAGYLGALLHDARGQAMLVNRGTRAWPPASLERDMAANIDIQFGRPDAPMVLAALRAVVEAPSPLLLLGQSLGGGLTQIQAVACLVAGRPARFASFAASDASRVVARRFGVDPAALPATIGDNWVSPRDQLTGPHSMFGLPRIGRQHLVEMQGPLLAWPGLSFHRAGAWVHHAGGRRVDAPAQPHPASASDWERLFPGQGAAPEDLG